ncbi:MAG: cupredoxin domain-containing protein [Coriobacteriia bacterium]
MTEPKMTTNKKTAAPGPMRYILIAGIILAAFAGSYGLAVAANGPARQVGTTPSGNAVRGPIAAVNGAPADPAANGSGNAPACACGGGAGSSEPIEGAAAVAGDVQKISVDVSKGYYDPNIIKLKAGVPAEITFSQSSGCTAQVLSKDLGFFEDLANGPVTVKLGALDAGTYSFSCGMEMVFGSIVVE